MISSIRLQNFRSYTDQTFQFKNGVNLIIGPNASGKTNLLEAILVLAKGKSYRGGDNELIRHDSEWARVDGVLGGQKRIYKLQGQDGVYIKSYDIDGNSLSRLTLTRKFPVVLFEPSHMNLLHGSPELRRAFLDDILVQTVPGYESLLKQYRRSLLQRSALLKKNPSAIEEQIFSWNVSLSDLGARIVNLRYDITRKLAKLQPDIYRSISGGSEEIEISYKLTFNLGSYSSLMLKKLQESTQKDLIRGFTSVGPHREDLNIEIHGKPASTVASRGETRTIIVSCKIASLYTLEEALGVQPILLLDDVFGELDVNRQENIKKLISGFQTFVTSATNEENGETIKVL